jgi:hypothetical protein
MNTRVVLEFDNNTDANDFCERMEEAKGRSISNYGAELLGLSVKDASIIVVEKVTTKKEMMHEVALIRDILDSLIESGHLHDIFVSRKESIAGITEYSEFHQKVVDIIRKIGTKGL